MCAAPRSSTMPAPAQLLRNMNGPEAPKKIKAVDLSAAVGFQEAILCRHNFIGELDRTGGGMGSSFSKTGGGTGSLLFAEGYRLLRRSAAHLGQIPLLSSPCPPQKEQLNLKLSSVRSHSPRKILRSMYADGFSRTKR